MPLELPHAQRFALCSHQGSGRGLAAQQLRGCKDVFSTYSVQGEPPWSWTFVTMQYTGQDKRRFSPTHAAAQAVSLRRSGR